MNLIHLCVKKIWTMQKVYTKSLTHWLTDWLTDRQTKHAAMRSFLTDDLKRKRLLHFFVCFCNKCRKNVQPLFLSRNHDTTPIIYLDTFISWLRLKVIQFILLVAKCDLFKSSAFKRMKRRDEYNLSRKIKPNILIMNIVWLVIRYQI